MTIEEALAKIEELQTAIIERDATIATKDEVITGLETSKADYINKETSLNDELAKLKEQNATKSNTISDLLLKATMGTQTLQDPAPKQDEVKNLNELLEEF